MKLWKSLNKLESCVHSFSLSNISMSLDRRASGGERKGKKR